MKTHENIKQRFQYRVILFFLLLIPSSILFAQGGGEVINLGLYGGASTDFSWAYSNNRIFSTVETPASLFYSDDNCATWTQAFPIDSLEYTTGGAERGWGGGGTRVLSNWVGWVAATTSEQGGNLSSSVISFSEGDSASFRTAYDGYLLHQVDPSYSSLNPPSSIALSDYWLYIGLGNALVRINDVSTYGAHNIVINFDTVSANNNIRWLAVSNDPSGYPVLIVAAVPGDRYGKLYNFDGSTLTEITGTGIPPTYGFERIFIHPADLSLDTLFASVFLKTGESRKLYRSLNGGSSWTDITYGGGTVNWALQNADYNPGWATTLTSSNGLRLSYPGVEKSDDLGNTWSAHSLADNATATSPTNLNYVIGSENKGPLLSTTGATGTFNTVDNEGHAAVRITKIAQKDTSLYYVSTKAGLGYTTAYKNPGVTGVDKWRSPYGDFPIAGVGTDGGVSSVAINPNDENHVIAGSNNGFYVTTSGPTGFYSVQPPTWNIGSNEDYEVRDIKFISTDTIIAVTGTGSNRLPNPLGTYGNIWLSVDGGNNWTKSTPTGTDGSGNPVAFEQGNVVVVGFGSADTIIYVGTGYWDQMDPSTDGQLWKSTDLGVTWSFVNYGPTGLNGGTTRMPIYDMDVHPDPDSNEVIYLATGQNLDYAFCKSMDAGATYHYLNVSAEGAFSSVLVKLTHPEIVSVAARRKLFRYNTVFNSPTLVFEGLPGEFVPDLETGSTLLGTTTGLYKLIEDPGSVTTIWNGNGDWTDNGYWSNGVPYDICNSRIESGTIVVDADGKLNNLTIASGAALTVASGKSLDVNGDLRLDSDATGYGSFIDDGSINVDGDVTVECYISADEWHYITPPVSDALGGVFNGLWLYYWDEINNDWEVMNSETEELLGGQGYKTWASSGTTGDATIEFNGTLNTGDFSPSLTLTEGFSETGWNLIGNDFPSAIDWGTENDPNPDFVKSNIDGTIYFWTGSQYATYNPSGNGLGTNGGTRYIASMQGFFVHANSSNPELTIPQSSRLHHPQSFREGKSSFPGISLTVKSEEYSDEVVVIPNPNSSQGFDSQTDAYKLSGIAEAPKFYCLSEGKNLAVNHMPYTDYKIDAYLGLEPGSSGIHSIETQGMDLFSSSVVITLEDISEDLIIDLKAHPIYTFAAGVNDDDSRFILHINASNTGMEEMDQPKEYLAYTTNGVLIIENILGNSMQGEMKVYDAIGETIFQQNLNGDIRQSFHIDWTTGVYIIEINDQNKTQIIKLIP